MTTITINLGQLVAIPIDDGRFSGIVINSLGLYYLDIEKTIWTIIIDTNLKYYSLVKTEHFCKIPRTETCVGGQIIALKDFALEEVSRGFKEIPILVKKGQEALERGKFEIIVKKILTDRLSIVRLYSHPKDLKALLLASQTNKHCNMILEKVHLISQVLKLADCNDLYIKIALNILDFEMKAFDVMSYEEKIKNCGFRRPS
jgi:hypothetical protein